MKNSNSLHVSNFWVHESECCYAVCTQSHSSLVILLSSSFESYCYLHKTKRQIVTLWMFASQLEIWFNEDAKFHFVPHMEHLQPEVLIPSLPPLYTCSIFSDYHILLPILHYESGIICSKEIVTLTIFYFDNLMHCSYSLTVDIFLIDSGRTKTMLVFFFLVLSTTCLHWFCPFRLALSEA